MKYIEITPEMDKTLAAICDSALKGQGILMMPPVNQMIAAIKEK